jgi:hypothetical protein
MEDTIFMISSDNEENPYLDKLFEDPEEKI